MSEDRHNSINLQTHTIQFLVLSSGNYFVASDVHTSAECKMDSILKHRPYRSQIMENKDKNSVEDLIKLRLCLLVKINKIRPPNVHCLPYLFSVVHQIFCMH